MLKAHIVLATISLQNLNILHYSTDHANTLIHTLRTTIHAHAHSKQSTVWSTLNCHSEETQEKKSYKATSWLAKAHFLWFVSHKFFIPVHCTAQLFVTLSQFNMFVECTKVCLVCKVYGEVFRFNSWWWICVCRHEPEWCVTVGCGLNYTLYSACLRLEQLSTSNVLTQIYTPFEYSLPYFLQKIVAEVYLSPI